MKVVLFMLMLVLCLALVDGAKKSGSNWSIKGSSAKAPPAMISSKTKKQSTEGNSSFKISTKSDTKGSVTISFKQPSYFVMTAPTIAHGGNAANLTSPTSSPITVPTFEEGP